MFCPETMSVVQSNITFSFISFSTIAFCKRDLFCKNAFFLNKTSPIILINCIRAAVFQQTNSVSLILFEKNNCFQKVQRLQMPFVENCMHHLIS